MCQVSVIIPVYNAEKYIKECIDSIVHQSLNDIEIILIDDGSIDNSAEICRCYAEHDQRIIFLQQKNAGPSGARNYGISVASGNYISFVDADDWLEENALEILMQFDSDIVMFDFYIGEKEHSEVVREGLYTEREIMEELYPKMISYVNTNGDIDHVFHNVWMRIYRRQFLLENNIKFPLEYKNGEDLIFTYEATLKAKSLYYLKNRYLYHYRSTQNSLTNAYIANYWINRKKIIEDVNDFIKTTEYSEELLKYMPLRILFWVNDGIKNALKNDKASIQELKLIMTDPLCEIFKNKINKDMLNLKNKTLYELICKGDYKQVYKNYKLKKTKKNIYILKKTIKKLISV